MNRDLILGATASLLLHFTTLYGNLFGGPHQKPLAPVEHRGPIIDIMPPPIEPDDPVQMPSREDGIKEELLYKRQIDLPTAVPDAPFVQVMQPLPVRPNLSSVATAINIASVGGSRDRIFDAALVDQIPQARFRTPPVYPFDMRREGIAGDVLVDFLVDTEGNALNVHAVSSSHREFENNAVQAVTKWKFRPGRKDGQNVITHMQVPIMFTLDQK